MGGEVVEVAASCNVCLYTPRQVRAVIIEVTRRLGKTDLYVDYIADFSVLYHLAYFLKVGKIAAVVSYKTRNTSFLRNAVDAGAVFITGCHRLFNIDRFSGLHCHDSKGGMGRGGRGDIDGIYIFITNELLHVGIPTWNIVSFGIRFCFFFVATHHSHYLRAFNHSEGGSTLFLGYFTATDKTPFYCF